MRELAISAPNADEETKRVIYPFALWRQTINRSRARRRTDAKRRTITVRFWHAHD
jgi:hypothetical protein